MPDAFQSHAFEPTAFPLTSDILDQSQLTQDTSTGINGGTNSAAATAQSFVPADGTISSVDLLISKTNSPTDNTIVEIQTDGATIPSGTVVGTSVSMASSSLPASASPAVAWIRFNVNAPVTVGTKYWLVCRRDVGGIGDSSNRPTWYTKVTTNPYASGGRSTFNGSTGVWGAESTTIDMAFKTYHPDHRLGTILVMPPPDRTR